MLLLNQLQVRFQNNWWWNSMAIILDSWNEIKTNHIDFVDRLKHRQDGLRCCFDIDLIFQEYSKTMIGDFKLIPLDEFTCKRTIVGINGTNIGIETTFGLTNDDFIDMEFQEVELNQKNYAGLKGLLISSSNHYFDIVNALAKHFGFVDNDNTNSFILDETELDSLKLVPFKLKYSVHSFIVEDIEDEMNADEYDGIVEQLYCSEFTF